MEDETPLLKSPASAQRTPHKTSAARLKELRSARDGFMIWEFFVCISWGIFVEIYSYLFYDVIDNGSYSKASLYSDTAMALYSVSSFFCSPVLATMSDVVGRKPIFILAAITDAITFIICGLVPNNWVFIFLSILQGAADATWATGNGLLADYVTGSPPGDSGSAEDGIMMRYLYVFIRLGARHDENDENMPSMGADYVQREMNIQFTMVLLFQTLGTVIGICLGDILYLWWGSYQWAFASAGFLLLPIVPWLWFMLPETVLDPKPITWSAVAYAISSQWDSIAMFSGSRRLWSVAFVNFLVQFVSAGLYGCILYWGEWKFGWDTTFVAKILVLWIFSGVVGAILFPRIIVDVLGYGYAMLISACCLISAGGALMAGLVVKDTAVCIAVFLFGLGFGNAPAIFAQISIEADPSDQGRVQGFNYAIMTAAWAIGPYAYWYMFVEYIDDDVYNDDNDEDDDHAKNTQASLFWWLSIAILVLAAAVMKFVAGDVKEQKLRRSA